MMDSSLAAFAVQVQHYVLFSPLMSKTCTLDVDKIAKLVAAGRSSPCDMMAKFGGCGLTPSKAIKLVNTSISTETGARAHVKRVLAGRRKRR